MNNRDNQLKPARIAAQIMPRLIRARDAPTYLGLDRNKFNAIVRPCLTEIPLGKQAIAFDRLELDAWVEDYIQRNGRPGRSIGDQLWDAKKYRVSSNARVSGISTNASAGGEFVKALEALGSKKPNASLRD